MTAIQPFVTQFRIFGKLENFVIKSNNCLKSLQVVSEGEEYWIKVAKEVRKSLKLELESGCFVQVTGMRKHDVHRGKVKYKAYKIELLAPATIKSTKNFSLGAKTKAKAKVLFCQKSTCWKKGGKATCESLKQELNNRGIADLVEIKKVGCLKQCKQAPNMVIMPDKARYSRIRPTQVSTLVEKHLL